jgi:hypothetical protein
VPADRDDDLRREIEARHDHGGWIVSGAPVEHARLRAPDHHQDDQEGKADRELVGDEQEAVTDVTKPRHGRL